MSLICPYCSSENIRSIDNQPLHHPTQDEAEIDGWKFDDEIYVEFACHSCHNTFTKTFSLVEK